MKRSWLVVVFVACRSPAPVAPAPVPPETSPLATWRVPAGWKRETIPFPLEFAPQIAHRGFEELRFPPGMFDPDQPGYWSYTFAWRTEGPAALDAEALAGELTTYFRGLLVAVDKRHQIASPETIVAHAEPDGPERFAVTARVVDAFATGALVELEGWAARIVCGRGALWVFVLARHESPLRAELDALAGELRGAC